MLQKCSFTENRKRNASRNVCEAYASLSPTIYVLCIHKINMRTCILSTCTKSLSRCTKSGCTTSSCKRCFMIAARTFYALSSLFTRFISQKRVSATIKYALRTFPLTCESTIPRPTRASQGPTAPTMRVSTQSYG